MIKVAYDVEVRLLEQIGDVVGAVQVVIAPVGVKSQLVAMV